MLITTLRQFLLDRFPAPLHSVATLIDSFPRFPPCWRHRQTFVGVIRNMSRSGQLGDMGAEKTGSYEYRCSPSSDYHSFMREVPTQTVSTETKNDEQTSSGSSITIQHLMTIPFGLLLLWFRQNNVLLFGRIVDLVWGVPAECMIWTVVILDLARQEITLSLRRC